MENQMQVAKQEQRGLEILQEYKSEMVLSDCKQEHLTKSMAYGITVCGLSAQNIPCNLEKAVLVDFLRENYPDYTPGEVKYAFNKAMARKFGPDVDVQCYGCFACEYIGRILDAYQRWNGGDMKGYEYTSFVDDIRLQERINGLYDLFLNGEYPEFYPSGVYHLLRQDGFFNHFDGPARRIFQKRMRIFMVFSAVQEKGYKALYVDAGGYYKPITQKPETKKIAG
jgi:hypothetical protein